MKPVTSSLVLTVAMLAIPFSTASGQEATASLTNSFMGLGDVAAAAKDLKLSSEAFERTAAILKGVATPVAEAMAKISSEFDPFGFKTAFRVVGRQAEMMQAQGETIRELQEREIKRLEGEAQKLKKKLKKQRKQRHKSKSKRKP